MFDVLKNFSVFSAFLCYCHFISFPAVKKKRLRLIIYLIRFISRWMLAEVLFMMSTPSGSVNFFRSPIPCTIKSWNTVDSSFTDAGGNKSYRLFEAEEIQLTDPWVITDIWFASRTNKEAVKVEENLHFIKLVFPILLNETWKGNQLIETDSNLAYLAGWNYQYTAMNVSARSEWFAFRFHCHGFAK